MDKRHLYLLAKAEEAATTIFYKQVKPLFVFHNIEHTRRVVEAAGKIMAHYELDELDRFAILLSAWFHDTGFSAGYIENHETLSIKIATDFLIQYQEPEDILNRVAACIAATRMPQKPFTLMEKIICDADLFHLGTSDFPALTELLRQEFQQYFDKVFSKDDWDRHNIDFLTKHTYFTSYCQQKLEPRKAAWIRALQQRIKG